MPRPSVLLLLTLLPVLAAAAPFLEPVPDTGLERPGATYGGAWADMDGDGRPDLALSRHAGAGPELYRNLGDLRFAPLELAAPEPGGVRDLHGVGVCDYDGDGRRDLMLSVGADRGMGRGEKQLWRHLEGPRFVNVAPAGGLIADGPGRGRGVLWLPSAAGRRPDLLLLNFATPARLFRPDDDAWRDASAEIAPPPGDGWTAAAAADFDGDGRVDLVVAGTAWAFFQGGPDGFTRPADGAGLPDHGPPLATVLAGDLDHDGDPDLVLVLRDMGVHLLRNDSNPGRPAFASAREHPTGVFCRDNAGAALADLDGDGNLDLVAAGGRTATVALGDGALGFRPLAPGEAGGRVGRSGVQGLDAVDLDDDGRLEVVVYHGKRYPNPHADAVRIFRVPTAHPGWGLVLATTVEPVHGLGARVILHTPAGDRVRQVRSVANPWCSTVPALHFAAGDADPPYDLTVRWPSGREQRVAIPSPGRTWLLRDDADHVVPLATP